MNDEVLEAAGGLGLFLLGLSLMTRGLRELGSDALARALRQFTRSPLSGCATGAMGTALLQSSSATTVAVVGFVGAGLLSFPEALGVIFGANLGTTITGWLVALFGFKLDLGALCFPAILVGALLHLLGRRSFVPVGLALAGFAMLLLGLGLLQAGLGSYESVVTPSDFPPDTWMGRLLLLALGVGITLVTQSSSAGVALAVTAVHTGTISFPQGGAMVIGMDVGTTFTAALATVGSSVAGRRTGWAHVIYNLMTGLMAFFLLPLYALGLAQFDANLSLREPELSLVGFHTLFNFLGVLLVLPFAKPFASLMERVIPDSTSPLTKSYERRLLAEPRLALEAVLDTLRATGRAALTVVRDLMLRGGSSADAARRLQPMRAALGETRVFLSGIVGTSERPELSRRHEALVRALDHLERLVARAERRDGADEAFADPRLMAEGRRLAETFAQVGAGFDQEEVQSAAYLARSLKESKESLRGDLVRAVAAGELDAEHALERIDEARQLRRIAHHVYRAVHHLAQAAKTEKPPSLPEDPRVEIPPE